MEHEIQGYCPLCGGYIDEKLEGYFGDEGFVAECVHCQKTVEINLEEADV